MKKLIVIADWASDSLTNQEFASSCEGFLKNPDNAKISFVASTPSTIHTSFLIAQITQTEERYGKPNNTVIFQNTDPRIQTKEGVTEARGADFIILKLKSGMYVCGPNAGFDFSMIKNKIEQAFIYRNLDKGSQFRSRDLYSRVSAHLMDSMEDELDIEEINISDIPDLKEKVIAHIDNFGNIKTNITKEDMKGKFEFGDEIKIKIGETTKTVKYTHNLFGEAPGILVIAPGSSGTADLPFYEIAVRIGDDYKSGKDNFPNCKPGDFIEIK